MDRDKAVNRLLYSPRKPFSNRRLLASSCFQMSLVAVTQTARTPPSKLAVWDPCAHRHDCLDGIALKRT